MLQELSKFNAQQHLEQPQPPERQQQAQNQSQSAGPLGSYRQQWLFLQEHFAQEDADAAARSAEYAMAVADVAKAKAELAAAAQDPLWTAKQLRELEALVTRCCDIISQHHPAA